MRKFGSLMLILLLNTAVLAACNPSTSSESQQPSPQLLEQIKAAPQPEGWREAQHSFAFSLYKELTSDENSETDNVLISPASIAIALAMAVVGAEGETKDAMLEALHMGDMNERDLSLYFAKLLQDFNSEEETSGVTMETANSLWIREGAPILDDYVANVQQFFQADANELDFDQAEAADTINKWVQDKTNDKIDSIVEPPIDPDTIAYLINAIYFNGTWKHAFDPELTEESTFYASSREMEHPFMSKNRSFLYLEEDQLQMISLPYGDGENERYSMMVLLPGEDSSLSELKERLSAEQWNAWLNDMKQLKGELKLPKFQLEFATSLVDSLKQLGMELPFDKERADFSRMADTSRMNVFISDVQHKTFIDVNEEGTEAAAVTSIEVGTTSATLDPEQPFVMNVNRPFFYVIYDWQTDSLLFMGEVQEPALGE